MALCTREGVTPFMALLAAFQVLLHRYSGQDDICVGTPIAGRDRSELEELIGFFANTLVLRARPSGRLTFRQLLAQVREMALGAYAHQEVPFEKLVEELQPVRSLSHTPLFQVMFSLQRETKTAQSLPGLTFRLVRGEGQSAKFDLNLTLAETPEGFAARSNTTPTSSTPRRRLGWWSTCGCWWKASSPTRSGPWPSCRCSPRRSGASCSWSGTTRAPTTRERSASTPSSRPRRSGRPTRWRRSSEASSSPIGS
jgi:non-ribosomal peptide synthetase component F